MGSSFHNRLMGAPGGRRGGARSAPAALHPVDCMLPLLEQGRSCSLLCYPSRFQYRPSELFVCLLPSKSCKIPLHSALHHSDSPYPRHLLLNARRRHLSAAIDTTRPIVLLTSDKTDPDFLITTLFLASCCVENVSLLGFHRNLHLKHFSSKSVLKTLHPLSRLKHCRLTID